MILAVGQQRSKMVLFGFGGSLLGICEAIVWNGIEVKDDDGHDRNDDSNNEEKDEDMGNIHSEISLGVHYVTDEFFMRVL